MDSIPPQKSLFRWFSILGIATLITWFATQAWGASGEGHGDASHTDPFAFVLLQIALIVFGALVGRRIALKLNQAPVLGELVFGVLLGNIGYWLKVPLFLLVMEMSAVGEIFHALWANAGSMQEIASGLYSATQLQPGHIGYEVISVLQGKNGSILLTMLFGLWMFSNLGVVILLFMVGLESHVDEMLGVGRNALMVAIVGVVAPFFLGIGVSYSLIPTAPYSVHLFLAATLCATSVGITARVFKDLGRLKTHEARIILGAAVIDDILGLIVLAVVAGIVATGSVNLSEVARISILAVIFLGATIWYGDRFVRFIFPAVRWLEPEKAKLLFPITLAFFLSWVANQIQLATIVGAFAAGLILSEDQFKSAGENTASVQQMIGRLEAVFAPIFFVLMGMQVNLESFLEVETLRLAGAFIVVAIVGKLVSGIVAGKKSDRLSVGIGMVPRGEVGLIFASIGKSMGVLSGGVFSAMVMMVIVTTLITPILLRWSLFRPDVVRTGN